MKCVVGNSKERLMDRRTRHGRNERDYDNAQVKLFLNLFFLFCGAYSDAQKRGFSEGFGVVYFDVGLRAIVVHKVRREERTRAKK